MHGRLFVTQNYICFHANIFGWETYLSLKWKEVTAIAKEKTAKVIPNAILLSTEKEKYFLTSFATRNKAFLMLFRVWQNALLNKPMSSQEIWTWVHNSYGDQLGLTSDDEDYIDPHEQKECLLAAPVISPVANCTAWMSDLQSIQLTDTDGPVIIDEPSLNVTTDMTDSSDSEDSYMGSIKCTSMHDGRQLVDTILPMSVDSLMLLLFSKSNFLQEFHTNRKSTNMVFNEWITNEQGEKVRSISLTVALTQPVGPKCTHVSTHTFNKFSFPNINKSLILLSKVTEVQLMRECSLPGQLYSIDVKSTNNGVPYADSFYVSLHYCLSR